MKNQLFRKLPKAEQERINNLNRIPVAPPAKIHKGIKDKPRRRRWHESDDS